MLENYSGNNIKMSPYNNSSVTNPWLDFCWDFLLKKGEVGLKLCQRLLNDLILNVKKKCSKKYRELVRIGKTYCLKPISTTTLRHCKIYNIVTPPRSVN